MGAFALLVGGETGAGHAFAEAALLEEVLFEPADLLIEEVIGLVDEADDDVGHDLNGSGFDKLAVGFVGDLFSGAELSDKKGFLGCFIPERVTTGAQTVA